MTTKFWSLVHYPLPKKHLKLISKYSIFTKKKKHSISQKLSCYNIKNFKLLNSDGIAAIVIKVSLRFVVVWFRIIKLMWVVEVIRLVVGFWIRLKRQLGLMVRKIFTWWRIWIKRILMIVLILRKRHFLV